MKNDELQQSARDDDLRSSIEELIKVLRRQPASRDVPLNDCDCELEACLLDKIARIACLNSNQMDGMARSLSAVQQAVESLLKLYQAVHPEQALHAERLAQLEAEMRKCCPAEDPPVGPCQYQPCLPRGRGGRGDGHSMKSSGRVEPVPFCEQPHPAWTIRFIGLNESDEDLPVVPQGQFVGQLIPAKPTDPPRDAGNTPPSPPGAQAPVTFRTFTETGLAANWPPDMSGARGGDVVMMSGNLWLKISVDGGKTFSDLDFTKLFSADATYGGWAGDQVIHYVPAIDCFVLYVQSYTPTSGTNLNKNVVKIAVASQTDLKTFYGGREAWKRQWDFTSDTFGLGASWMDFPDISYGAQFLHVNTNVFAGKTGKLFFELPLVDMQAGRGFGFQFAFIDDAGVNVGSPIQNIQGDDNYFAAHVSNSKLRIYSSRGGDPTYSWRERDLANWPRTSDNNIVSAAPDSADWVSEDHRIIGATRVGTQLWFAWTASSGDGGGGGFKFPQPHVQIAKLDVAKDFKVVEQTQVWNADHAYCYPCLTTNSDDEVGISLSWGGGKFYGSHAVGIFGDFIVWYGALSDVTLLRQKVDGAGILVVDSKGNPVLDQTRWGDYVHVRLAHPDLRFFGAFGYSVKKDAAIASPNVGRFDYAYVEFGRETLGPPPGPR